MLSAHRPRRPQVAGWTLLEALVVVCIAGLLAATAYPAYTHCIRTARRSEAIAGLMSLQAVEERFRSSHPTYGSLADLGPAMTVNAPNYTLVVSDPQAAGYTLLAAATGSQQADTACRYLQLSSVGAEVRYASGGDAAVGNAPDANRQCWRT